MDHWDRGGYPPIATTYTPLTWQADWSNRLAIDWRNRLDDALRQNRRLLKYCPNTKLRGKPVVNQGSDSAHCFFTTENPHTGKTKKWSKRCSLVLMAVGPGCEKTYLRSNGSPPPPKHPARGYRFWDDDPFLQSDLGFPRELAPRILISGSGDGALQDFLRLVLTCRSPAEAYIRLQVPDSYTVKLLSADQRAQRTLQWGRNANHDHEELAAVHQLHQEIVGEVLTPALSQRLDALLRDPLHPVQLLHECKHFSSCYSLNRFLVLLVAKHLELQGKWEDVLLPGRQLVEIKSKDASHQCAGDASDCHRKWHEAFWVDKQDCRSQFPVGTRQSSLDANVLILRHGIDMADVRWDPTPVRNRQLLPYFLLG